MLVLLRLVVIALVAAFGTASGALAFGSKTALRAPTTIGTERVGELRSEACGTRRRNLAVATTFASECCHAARGVSPIVQGGGLMAHELAGGHVLARRVGKTSADLAGRLAARHHGSQQRQRSCRERKRRRAMLGATAARAFAWVACWRQVVVFVA